MGPFLVFYLSTGASGRGRTGIPFYRGRVLSPLSIPISPHLQILGVPPGTRTPTNSFGDCHAAITLEIHILAEVVGFEPTDPFEPSVFKTAALSHAQPYFLNLVAEDGFEPPTSRL